MSAKSTEIRKLMNILEGVDCKISGSIELTEITGLCSDSRKVRPQNLFAAIKGLAVDGHAYLDEAVASGCSALLVERGWENLTSNPVQVMPVPLIEVEDTRIALGKIAANFYGHPERELTLIGITGTNGKTTTSFLVESFLKTCGKNPGVIGTVNYRYSDKNGEHIVMEAPFTTPESTTLFSLLREMTDAGITDIVMEVSSHALAQERLSGISFDIAVFTNLSRDHLDFHTDMADYFSSKKLLFTDYLRPDGQIVIMLDSGQNEAEDSEKTAEEPFDWGCRLNEELGVLFSAWDESPAVTTCGLNGSCDVHPAKFKIDLNGIEAEVVSPAGSFNLAAPLVGEFNLRNMLCAVGIGIAHGEEPECIQKGIEDVKTIPGRLEKVLPPIDSAMQNGNSGRSFPAVMVDYAHTPDALRNVLTTLRKFHPKRLICIFGCGGDRDPGKRGPMGKIAGTLSDVVLATSDNPRSESPEQILKEIEKGLTESPLQRRSVRDIMGDVNGRGYDVIPSRRLAIATVINSANPDDVILISGKGHENYQLKGKTKIFFDDRIEADMQLHKAAGLPHIWKLDWIRQITGGWLKTPGGKVVFRNISTDSRSISSGDLFVALKGENFDGRTFTGQAVHKGAAGILVSRPADSAETLDTPGQIPVILVEDSLFALGELAAERRRWNRQLKVLALTGSSGKTTVKEMLGAILSRKHSILKTRGNFNNLIGLPLTLLELKEEHEMAVLEMGMNRPGEISRLTEIADPDIGCIINIQEAHLEGLGDIQGVARAKNELFTGLRPEGIAVVNMDDKIIPSLAEQLHQEKITFGCSHGSFVRATEIESLGREGMGFTLHIGAQKGRVQIQALGNHNISNSLAAAAMAHAAGIGINEIIAGLTDFSPFEKRSRIEELDSGILVLNDCYNANPASMMAALHTLKSLQKEGRGVAVLGDMLELGAKSNEAHLAIGRAVAELGIDFLATFGGQAQLMVNGALDAGMTPEAARGFDSKKDLVIWLGQLVQERRINPGDWLLLKGSRGMRMEEVLALLNNDKNTIKAAGN